MRFGIIAEAVGCAWAQPTFEIHAVTGRASARLEEAERRFRVAKQVSWRESKASEEITVVDAVAGVYRRFFRPEIQSQPRIATITEKGKDILIGRWPVGAHASQLSELIVWDTPEDTSFLLQLPAKSWGTETAVRNTFQQLLWSEVVFGQTRVAQGVILNLARDPIRAQNIGAGGLLRPRTSRQFDVGLVNWFDLWSCAAGKLSLPVGEQV